MPLCRSPLTLRLALFSRSRTAAVEIPRFILHRRRSEFLPLHRGAKKRAQSPLCDPYTGEPRFALSSPQRSLAQGSRELHLIAAVALPLQDVPRPAAHLNISPKGEIFHTRKARISPRRRRDFTRQRSCRISLSARAKPKHERRTAKEPRFALRKATVMRTKILSVTPLNPLGVTAPLINKGSQVPSPQPHCNALRAAGSHSAAPFTKHPV